MLFHVMCFVTGVVWLQQQPELPVPGWTWLAAISGLAALFTAPENSVLRAVRAAVLGATFAVAGFALAAWTAQVRLADVLPPEWEGRDIAIVGVVAGMAVMAGSLWLLAG